VLVIGLAAFIWIRSKPPSLQFFDARIQEVLKPLASPCEVRYKDIRLAWPKGRFTPGITITDARCLINGDTVLARFPEITMRLSLAALIRGNVEPTEIWLARPRINAAHMAHMEKRGGLGAKEVLDAINRPEFFDHLFSFAKRHEDFKRLHAADGRLVLPGNPNTVEISLPSVVLSMLHVQEEPELIMTAAYVLNDQASRIQMVIHAPPAKGSDTGKVSESRITCKNLHPPILAELAPDLAPLRGLDFTADVEMLFRVTAGGTVDNLRFNIESTTGGTLFHPDIWEAPIPVQKLTAQGWLKNAFTQLKLASFHVESRKTIFDATGTIDNLGAFDAVSLDVRVDGLNPALAHQYWPYRVIPHTRTWIRNHFLAGEINDAVAKIRIAAADLAAPVLPKGIIDVMAPFKGVAMKYHDGLEPIEEAAGTARFTGHDITIDVTGARNYDTRATDGKVVIGNFTEHPVRIDIQANAKGPADDLRKAVDALTGNGAVPVKIAAGKAVTRLAFQWPLADFSEETFDYHAASKIQGMEVADFFGFRWEQKTLLISLDRQTLAVSGEEGEISSETELEKAVPIKKFDGRGELSYHPAGIDVTAFSADLGGPTINFTGKTTTAAPFPRIFFDGTIDALPLKAVHQYWPRRLASPVRDWIHTHVPDGRITHAAVKLDLDPEVSSPGNPPKTAIVVDAAFNGVHVDYLPPLPPVREGKGSFTLTTDAARILLDSGQVGHSKITAAQADITDIPAESPTIDIQAEIAGPAADLVAAAGAMAKKNATARSLPPLNEALAATRVHVRIPINGKAAAGEADYALTSDITNITIADFYGFTLTDGQVAAALENGRLLINGNIDSGQTPVSVHYEQNAQGKETIRLSSRITPDHHSDFHLPAMPFLSGSIPAVVDIDLTEAGLDIASRLDFTDAAIDLNRWGWVKPAGTPAVLQSRGTLTPGKALTVSELTCSGENLDIKGSGKIALENPASFDFQFDPLNVDKHRLVVQAAFNADKGYRIDLNGGLFDAAGLMERKPRETADTTPTQKLQGAGVINIGLDKALLAGGIELYDPKGRITWGGEKIRSAVIDGAFKKDAGLHVAITPDQEPGKILIQTEDAGALLKGTNLYSNIRSGRLIFDGRSDALLPTEKPVSGKITVKDFLLVNAPGLMKVLSMASFVGAMDQLQHGGIGFSSLEGDLSCKNNVISLQNGRMEGISIAMTAEGNYDMENRMTDIRGVVIPVNILNQVIEIIPVFGKWIVGEGIIATDYTIKGPSNDPDVSIKPLSTLSVGFLRNLFKIFDFKPADTGAGVGEARKAPSSGKP